MNWRTERSVARTSERQRTTTWACGTSGKDTRCHTVTVVLSLRDLAIDFDEGVCQPHRILLVDIMAGLEGLHGGFG